MKLPIDCDADYHKGYISEAEADALFSWICTNCDGLESNEVRLADGTTHLMDTGKLMFVEPELVDYSVFPEPHGKRVTWPPLVAALRDRLEQVTGRQFDVCVCICYRDGGGGRELPLGPLRFRSGFIHPLDQPRCGTQVPAQASGRSLRRAQSDSRERQLADHG